MHTLPVFDLALIVLYLVGMVLVGLIVPAILLAAMSTSSRRSGNAEALTATIIGVLVILRMTFPHLMPPDMEAWCSPLHNNMIIVAGTLTIFLAGLLLTRLRRKPAPVPRQKQVLTLK